MDMQNDVPIAQDSQLRDDLNVMLQAEESFYHQKSWVQWLSLGDRNIHFFHAAVWDRRAHNNISVFNREGTACVVGSYKGANADSARIEIGWAKVGGAEFGSCSLEVCVSYVDLCVVEFEVLLLFHQKQAIGSQLVNLIKRTVFSVFWKKLE
ncbi:hypothetical protein Ancab_001800 [Ancistrocladus abbreviatus]